MHDPRRGVNNSTGTSNYGERNYQEALPDYDEGRYGAAGPSHNELRPFEQNASQV